MRKLNVVIIVLLLPLLLATVLFGCTPIDHDLHIEEFEYKGMTCLSASYGNQGGLTCDWDEWQGE